MCVVNHFGWSWASSIWCTAASSLSLFFVISICSIISGWFVLKTIWIYRIMRTFDFFPRNAFIVLIFAIFTFSLIFAGGRTSANRWSLRPFRRCEIRVFSFGFWTRLVFFLSSSLVSLVIPFAWNHSFQSWSFSTSSCFFNGFFLFRGIFASVWFSQIWWFIFRLLLFFLGAATAHSSATANFFTTAASFWGLWFNLESFVTSALILYRLAQLLSIRSDRRFAPITCTHRNLTRLNFIGSVIITIIFVSNFVIASFFVGDIGNYTRWLMFAIGSTMATLRITSPRCQLRVILIFHLSFYFIQILAQFL